MIASPGDAAGPLNPNRPGRLPAQRSARPWIGARGILPGRFRQRQEEAWLAKPQPWAGGRIDR